MSDPHDFETRREISQKGRRIAHEGLHNLAQAYRATFSSDAGRRVLQDLVSCYDGSSMGHSPRKTEIHAAQRDVLLRVQDLIALASADPDDMSLSSEIIENLLNPWSRYEDSR